MAKSVFYSRKNYMCDPNLAGKLKRDLEVAFFLLPPSSVLWQVSNAEDLNENEKANEIRLNKN